MDRKRDIEETTLPQTPELLADLKCRVEANLQNALGGTTHFVVGIHWSGDSRRLSVKIDGDQGVSIDVCATLNRSLGKLIDEHGWQGPIVLEVGSPGAETPLVMQRQFPQHIGRQLKISMLNGSVIMGYLTELNSENLVLKEQEAPEIRVNFQEIKEAKVVIF